MKALLLTIITLLILLSGTGCNLLKIEKNKFKPEMIYVSGGSFFVGDFFEATNSDALPIHQAFVSDFKIAKYEVTYSQFDYYARRNGLSNPKSDLLTRGNRAVSYVTWDEALGFCSYFGMRLPTEIEWEFAARSGGKKQVISGATTLDSIYVVALTKHELRSESEEVGTKKPNDLGIFDMSGNVFEWIGDYYQFYTKPGEMHNIKSDDMRLIRGGSYYENILANRTYWRTGTLRDIRSEDVGFRCVEDI